MLFTALSNQLKNVNDIMTINLKGGGINMKQSDSTHNSSEGNNEPTEKQSFSLATSSGKNKVFSDDEPSENIWRAKYLKYKIKYLELYYKHFLQE